MAGLVAPPVWGRGLGLVEFAVAGGASVGGVDGDVHGVLLVFLTFTCQAGRGGWWVPRLGHPAGVGYWNWLKHSPQNMGALLIVDGAPLRIRPHWQVIFVEVARVMLGACISGIRHVSNASCSIRETS